MDDQINCLAIVANMDVGQVTWAPSFIDAARKSGIRIAYAYSRGIGVSLFIGDRIPWEKVENEVSVYYFLAASSIGSKADGAFELEKRELFNMRRAAGTFVPSNAERNKVLSRYGMLSGKIHVVGFPFCLEEVSSHRKRKIPKSVCFACEPRKEKNIGFELYLIDRLVAQGYTCIHMSPGPNQYREIMKEKGCQVLENNSRKDFLDRMGEYTYYISTSHYESLSCTAIEAAVLGCIPITPDRGGFTDWIPDENRYRNDHVDTVLDVLEKAVPIDDCHPMYARYDHSVFFSRLKEICCHDF